MAFLLEVGVDATLKSKLGQSVVDIVIADPELHWAVPLLRKSGFIK
jgi:hypothetical protein